MSQRTRAAALLLALSLTASPRAVGEIICLIPQDDLCALEKQARSIAIGRVVSRTEVTAREEFGPRYGEEVVAVDIAFAIDEVIKGSGMRAGEIITEQKGLFNPCDTYAPPVGTRLLLMGAGERGGFLGACGGTTNYNVDGLAAIYRQIASGRKPPRLTMSLIDYDRGVPVAGVEVEFAQGARRWRGVSDEYGNVESNTLPPGAYRLKISHPQLVWKPGYESDHRLNLARGCWVGSIPLLPRNSVRGRLLAPNGTPVKRGFLSIDGYPNVNGYATSRSTYTDKKGRFEFVGLLPGRYTVEAPRVRTLGQKYLTKEDTVNNPSAFYPGTLDRDVATVLTLDQGSEIDLGDFQVPHYLPAN